MIKEIFTSVLFIIALSGCTGTYKKSSIQPSNITFKVDKAFQKGLRISAFLGSDCKKHPNGQLVGSLFKGGLLVPSVFELSIFATPNETIAFEIHEQLKGELPTPGNYRVQRFALTPEIGRLYTVKYGNSGDVSVFTEDGKDVDIIQTHGACKGNFF